MQKPSVRPALLALGLFCLCVAPLPALAQDAAESRSVGALDMLGVGLLLLSAVLGAFVRRHNWWKVCLAALAGVVAAGGMTSSNLAIIPYVLNGSWTRGFNLFAMTRIVLLIMTIIRILLRADGKGYHHFP